MKKKYIISMLLIPLFLCFCSGSKVTENNLGNGLKFYLLKDSTITANEIMWVNLSDLTLAEQPFLSYKDLQFSGKLALKYNEIKQHIEPIKKGILQDHIGASGNVTIADINAPIKIPTADEQVTILIIKHLYLPL